MDRIIPNVLYDERRPEKYPLFIEEIQKQGIEDYKIWSPIFSKTVVQSINLSQKEIVRWSKEKGRKYCCIFEDDIMFTSKDSWNYFIEKMPASFDVYCGGSYLIDNRNDYKKPLVKVSEWVGNHCIIIHERYYDTFLSIPEHQHIDVANKDKGEFYICFPFIALQRPSWSLNIGDNVNYNHNIPKGFIYQ